MNSRHAAHYPATDNPDMSNAVRAPAARFSPRALGLAAAVVTVIIWTSFIVIARATGDPARGGGLSPLDISMARVLGASLLLLPWGWWLVRKDRRAGSGQSCLFGLSPLPWRITAQIGMFGGFLYALVVYSGFVFAPAAHASVLMPGSMPLWTTLLAALLLKERILAGRALGLTLILSGGLLVGGASLLQAFDGGQVWQGDLLFMSAALCWSTYSVLARKYALDPVRATIAVTAFAFFFYLPLYSLLLLTDVLPNNLLSVPVPEFLFHALFQGWGSVVISGIGFTLMIQHYGPVRSTMITALVPGLSALAAVLWLGEPLHWNLLAGLMLVTLGIVFGVRQSQAELPNHGAKPGYL